MVDMNKAEIVLSQIQAIRRTGKVNMFDVSGVTTIAERLHFNELVNFAATPQYFDFIMTGNKALLPKN